MACGALAWISHLVSKKLWEPQESHTHYFFITVTNDSTYDYPSYYMTRTIDDVTLYWYDSDNEVVERRVPWFESPDATLLDASISQYYFQRRQQRLFQKFNDYLNDTEDFHYLQLMLGCTSYDNETIGTVFSYRYDGEPFLTFSVEEARWIAEVTEAQHFADEFNMNRSLSDDNRRVLLNTCVPHIAELLSLGNCTFSRSEEPVVIINQTSFVNSTCTLYCRAYGHYPKDIVMNWYRNGEQVLWNQTEKVTLPFPDITYLTTLAINISLADDNVYTCRVHHSSMMDPYMGEWRLSWESDEQTSNISTGIIIAICLAAILLVVLLLFGAVSFQKSRRQPHGSSSYADVKNVWAEGLYFMIASFCKRKTKGQLGGGEIKV
ncbi:major histocompatibility complex class I-related gene protein-like [Gastrophryne carolinensis]